jgi:hypothetical protein
MKTSNFAPFRIVKKIRSIFFALLGIEHLSTEMRAK